MRTFFVVHRQFLKRPLLLIRVRGLHFFVEQTDTRARAKAGSTSLDKSVDIFLRLHAASRLDTTLRADVLREQFNVMQRSTRGMALVERYRDCTEYSDEVLRQFVEKVIVHETVKDEDGERSREIEVYLNFIGKFDVPVQPVELSPEEQKRQEALKKRRIHQRNKRAQARQERMNAQLKNESPI